MPRTKKQDTKSKGKKGKKGQRSKTKTAPASGGVAVSFVMKPYLNPIVKKESKMETRYRSHEKDQKVPEQHCYSTPESTLPEIGP